MNEHRILPGVTIALLAVVTMAVSAAEIKAPAPLVRDACPGLTTGALASAKLVTLPSGVVLRSGEMKITQKDLDSEIAKAPEAVRGQLKSNLFFLLENKATKSLLDSEASSWAKKNKRQAGESPDALMQAYLTSLTGSLLVNDDEVKSFFENNKDMFGEATFDQVKDQVKDYILGEKSQDAINAHVAKLGERYEIRISKVWAEKQYSAAMANPIDKARKSGKPTMVDLGADGCRPCDMMTPILESLRKDYAGKANVLFVHVRKEQVLAARYGVQSIPLQIFFDKDGKEVFRHVGFFPKDQITAKLAEMGVK